MEKKKTFLWFFFFNWKLRLFFSEKLKQSLKNAKTLRSENMNGEKKCFVLCNKKKILFSFLNIIHKKKKKICTSIFLFPETLSSFRRLSAKLFLEKQSKNTSQNQIKSLPSSLLLLLWETLLLERSNRGAASQWMWSRHRENPWFDFWQDEKFEKNLSVWLRRS